MKLLWNQIIDTTRWINGHCGVYTVDDAGVHFFHEGNSRGGICCETFDANGLIGRKEFHTDHYIWLPHEWLIMPKTGTLLCSDLIGIDLAQNRLLDEVPKDMEKWLWQKVHEKEKTEEKLRNGVQFNNYTVFQCGECSIKCARNGTDLWKKRLVGYIYTDILPVGDDRIMLGTSGAGGRFYLFDLATGNVISEINTGGTEILVTDKTVCYLIDRKQNLLLAVSLESGDVLDSIRVPGKLLDYYGLFHYEKWLFVISFQKKSGVDYVCMNCIEI